MKNNDMFRVVFIKMKHCDVFGGTSIITFKNSVSRMTLEISIPNQDAFKIDSNKVYSFEQIEEMAKYNYQKL